MKKKLAPCIAVLGTGSDVGKSIVTTALCRILSNMGYRVAPFKAQNMSNNSGVTPEGMEMGRAQIVQAEAARVAPHVDMNPILLKPTGEKGAQLVLLGNAVENNTALEYHRKKENLFRITSDALDRLRAEFDVIVMEGAGSCAEVNLMDGDIVNLRIAEYSGAPVVLVGDIHRGGIFAQLAGTLLCLTDSQKDLISGFVVNRFRGDIRLFEDGVRWIEEKTDRPVFGVLPWYSHIRIEAEDSVVIENPLSVYPGKSEHPAVAVIRIPHISNFTDFDPLNGLADLDVYFVETVQDLSIFNAVVLPGSKNTRSDLDWFKKTGWATELNRYVKQEGHVLGICGGYQMLGKAVHDPDGLEGAAGTTPGLNLLPVETTLKAPKITTRTRFNWGRDRGFGYEIHMGSTLLTGGAPLFSVFERNGIPTEDYDGCRSDDDRIIGTYVHGMFDSPGVVRRWLKGIGLPGVKVPEVLGPAARDLEYERLADHFNEYINTDSILKLIDLE